VYKLPSAVGVRWLLGVEELAGGDGMAGRELVGEGGVVVAGRSAAAKVEEIAGTVTGTLAGSTGTWAGSTGTPTGGT